MKYMGSKNRIAKYILPIMLSYRKPDQYWVEPFVGGGNTIDKVEGNRVGADINPYVIEALLEIRDHVDDLPKNNKEFTEEDYNLLKLGKGGWLTGYAGFAFSYGGKFLGGWCRDGKGERDYVEEAYRNAVKQSPKLQGIKLYCCNYQHLPIPLNSVIYCDPPYQNTTKYKDKFDHDKFWDWCRLKSKEGHTVFISEYDAPPDFKFIWGKEITSSLTQNTGAKHGIERLFIHESSFA